MTDKVLERTMTVSDAATPFGCCNFFDNCADGIMSLHYAGLCSKFCPWFAARNC